MTSAQTKLLTVAEFLRLPDPKEGHYELHHGEVVLMPPPKRGHWRIQDRLVTLLKPKAGKGVVGMEMDFCPSPEWEVWQADVACVSKKRDAAVGDDEYLTGSPELVIEVLSPSNTSYEILERQEICFANGCLAFWTVDPKRQTVMVTTPDFHTHTYGPIAFVPLPFPMTGDLSVADIFSKEDPQTSD